MTRNESTHPGTPVAGRGVIKLIECPRDAMQGWKTFIPTEKKVEYLNSLLKVGFDTIDFGSFVSPQAIPQMRDTKEVISKLKVESSRSKLLAIVANDRGADEAARFDEIRYLGFPFSVSETFQQRNTNESIAGSLVRVQKIQDICMQKSKELVVYISMGFGNPYGDAYSEDVVFQWVHTLAEKGIGIISLADTVGMATPEKIQKMTLYLQQTLPQIELGVHLHSAPQTWKEKVEAAYAAGCRRFDGALKGIGGCPMANDDLVGNINMEQAVAFFEHIGESTHLDATALHDSLLIADEIFTA